MASFDGDALCASPAAFLAPVSLSTACRSKRVSASSVDALSPLISKPSYSGEPFARGNVPSPGSVIRLAVSGDSVHSPSVVLSDKPSHKRSRDCLLEPSLCERTTSADSPTGVESTQMPSPLSFAGSSADDEPPRKRFRPLSSLFLEADQILTSQQLVTLRTTRRPLFAREAAGTPSSDGEQHCQYSSPPAPGALGGQHSTPPAVGELGQYADASVPPAVQVILDSVAQGFNLGAHELRSTSKKPLTHLARQLVWDLIMAHTPLTQLKAAQLMRVKNHKSVSRAIQNWAVKRTKHAALAALFPGPSAHERLDRFGEQVAKLSVFVRSNFRLYVESFTTTAVRQRRARPGGQASTQ